jgi:hypothetical protein
VIVPLHASPQPVRQLSARTEVEVVGEDDSYSITILL